MTPWPRENNDMTNMKTNKDVQSPIFFSKPCQVNIDQTILREFYRKRFVEPKTKIIVTYVPLAAVLYP